MTCSKILHYFNKIMELVLKGKFNYLNNVFIHHLIYKIGREVTKILIVVKKDLTTNIMNCLSESQINILFKLL